MKHERMQYIEYQDKFLLGQPVDKLEQEVKEERSTKRKLEEDILNSGSAQEKERKKKKEKETKMEIEKEENETEIEKEENETEKKNEIEDSRVFSDNPDEMCRIICQICKADIFKHSLRKHFRAEHPEVNFMQF